MDNSVPDVVTIEIAGIAVRLDLRECDRSTRGRIAERYAAFLAPNALPAVVVQLRIEGGDAFIPLAKSPNWVIQAREDNGRLHYESHWEQGWVERVSNRAELTMRPIGDPENFLRVLYAWLSLAGPALLLHACGVIRDGAGYVFFGPSGDGKTTIASLSGAYNVLSDDLVILKKAAGGAYRVYGVPFRGDFPTVPRANANAELRGLFTLVKASGHHLAPMSAVEAVARLAACVPFVMNRPASAQRVVTTCSDLQAHVPVRALHFARNSNFWELIE